MKNKDVNCLKLNVTIGHYRSLYFALLYCINMTSNEVKKTLFKISKIADFNRNIVSAISWLIYIPETFEIQFSIRSFYILTLPDFCHSTHTYRANMQFTKVRKY